MARRSKRLRVVSIRTAHLSDADRQRLWRELVRYAVDEGGGFSVQPEVLRRSPPPEVAADRELLLAHL